jgi:hypothetical protein
MDRGPGELQREIGEVLAKANRHGEGLTAREICLQMNAGAYVLEDHVGVLRFLRKLEQRGAIVRKPERYGARKWWIKGHADAAGEARKLA